METNVDVYVGMSADILHPGHINILKNANKYGKVTVGLLTDEAIASYKKIPIMSFLERKSVIKEIKYVDNIVAQNTLDYSENLKKFKPKFVVHGDDWKVGVQKEIREKVIKTLNEWGGELIELPYTESISSSDIRTRLNVAITTESRRGSLKNLLEKNKTLRFLDIHNPLSGIVIENAKFLNNGLEVRFDGMWASSLTDSTSRGKPDIEAVDTSSRVNTLHEIMEVTSKPIIYDGDTGGKPEHFKFTIQSLERIGVSAVVIEDKKGLKKNSLFGTDVKQEQEDIESFCEKIDVGISSKKTDDFMLFARVESLILKKGINDAIERAKKYDEAGADGILIHSKEKDESEVFEFISKFKRFSDTKIIVVPTTYNHVHFETFKNIGVNIVIYANHLLRSAYPSMLNSAEAILRNGRTLEIEDNLMTVRDIINFIPEN
jgi:phosphoenolpyruvate mutase